MSLVDRFDLADYTTVEELKELLAEIEHETSTLRSYKRGAEEKLEALEQAAEDAEEVG